MKKVIIISREEIKTIASFEQNGLIFSNGDQMSYSALSVAGKEFEEYYIDEDSYLHIENENNLIYTIPPCAWTYTVEPDTPVLAWNKESYKAHCKIYIGKAEHGQHTVIDLCTKEGVKTSIFDYVLPYSKENLELVKTRLKGE